MPDHAGFAIAGMSPVPRDRVLIVEDDAEFGAELAGMLRRYGFDATVVSDPRQMTSALAVFSPNIMILDQFLQDTDMLSRLDEIRRSFQGGLMVLTGNNDISDKVLALEHGADDFVLKTTHPREVLARLRALGRRRTAERPLTGSPVVISAEQNLAGWTVDTARREVRSPKGEVIPLGGSSTTSSMFCCRHRARSFRERFWLRRFSSVEFTLLDVLSRTWCLVFARSLFPLWARRS